MTRLFVIPGHGAGDPGACGNGYTEAERVRALAQRIKDLGGDSVTLADFSRDYFADDGISRLDMPDDYSIVELHMDAAASDSACGGHVIVYPGTANAFDEKLAGMMADVFPGRPNLISERDNLANPCRAYAKGYDYRLTENGFITNAGDVDTFNSRMDYIASGYLAAFGIIEEGFDMAEALFYIDDDHEGYQGGDIVYWSPEAGFCYLEHPDCVALLRDCSPSIKEVHSASNYPWIVRAKQATRPSAAAETFGKRE